MSTNSIIDATNATKSQHTNYIIYSPNLDKFEKEITGIIEKFDTMNSVCYLVNTGDNAVTANLEHCVAIYEVVNALIDTELFPKTLPLKKISTQDDLDEMIGLAKKEMEFINPDYYKSGMESIVHILVGYNDGDDVVYMIGEIEKNFAEINYTYNLANLDNTEPLKLNIIVASECPDLNIKLDESRLYTTKDLDKWIKVFGSLSDEDKDYRMLNKDIAKFTESEIVNLVYCPNFLEKTLLDVKVFGEANTLSIYPYSIVLEDDEETNYLKFDQIKNVVYPEYTIREDNAEALIETYGEYMESIINEDTKIISLVDLQFENIIKTIKTIYDGNFKQDLTKLALVNDISIDKMESLLNKYNLNNTPSPYAAKNLFELKNTKFISNLAITNLTKETINKFEDSCRLVLNEIIPNLEKQFPGKQLTIGLIGFELDDDYENINTQLISLIDVTFKVSGHKCIMLTNEIEEDIIKSSFDTNIYNLIIVGEKTGVNERNFKLLIDSKVKTPVYDVSTHILYSNM